MKLSTRLTIYLSLLIVVVLAGYGYVHILSRRDILVRKMKAEVRSTGRTLKVALEKIALPREMEYVQDLIDAVVEDEKTLGVVVYHQPKNLVFRSRSLGPEMEPYVEEIKKAIREDTVLEAFGRYEKQSIFAYTFPLKDKRKKPIGGVSILQRTSFMEDDIRKAGWNIFVSILLLILGTVAFIHLGTKRWLSQPISEFVVAIRKLAQGDFTSHIDLKRKDEISEMAREFNQMAMDLRKAREEIIEEGERRLELERALRQSDKLAAIGQLASELAHEIGTPLNIIAGRAELTRRKVNEKGLEKNLDVVIEQTAKITKIIQQLLGFVRKKKPEQKPLNFNLLLRTALDLLDHQIRKQKITVTTALTDALPVVIGDPDQIQQVFLNLLLNAIQAMPQGGTLRVGALSRWVSKPGLEEGERCYVEIFFSDSGTGMEKDVIEHIFDPFYSTKHGGTGLGLTVSRGIIEEHEGWIDVESQIGKGSVFRVYLPGLSQEVKQDG